MSTTANQQIMGLQGGAPPASPQVPSGRKGTKKVRTGCVTCKLSPSLPFQLLLFVRGRPLVSTVPVVPSLVVSTLVISSCLVRSLSLPLALLTPSRLLEFERSSVTRPSLHAFAATRRVGNATATCLPSCRGTIPAASCA